MLCLLILLCGCIWCALFGFGIGCFARWFVARMIVGCGICGGCLRVCCLEWLWWFEFGC